MAEEFEESEVVFEENNDGGGRSDGGGSEFGDFGKEKRKKARSYKSFSVPVRIPENAALRNSRRPEMDGGDGGEMVPPHVITAGRHVAGDMMAFSVCTGNGRTLKGRDLSQVRNSVLRMTGFLET
ncbi:uncharacterized protein LOC127249834 [Andrographis paniculata]|uniref:uncharacterized protein LOC127249834 n=1 Tax=Andrographis paniculata TaxID=175694 RepID=UPI0021E6F91B|nr:uncharacterized protein LOC127249834 [Andrographis paniculata]